jgi:hypothetical protein
MQFRESCEAKFRVLFELYKISKALLESMKMRLHFLQSAISSDPQGTEQQQQQLGLDTSCSEIREGAQREATGSASRPL